MSKTGLMSPSSELDPGLGSKANEMTKSPDASVPMTEPFGDLDGELSRLASSTKSNFKNLSIKELYQRQWKNMKSWGGFMDTSRMRTPTSTMLWSRRLIRNLEYFQSNYVCVFLVLVIYCVLTSPLLLLALGAALGACYIVTLKNAESPVKLFGYKISLGQQYLGIATLSFPLFYLAGAGSAVFWVLGASFFVIGLHASIFAIEMGDTSLEEGPFQFSPPTLVEDI